MINSNYEISIKNRHQYYLSLSTIIHFKIICLALFLYFPQPESTQDVQVRGLYFFISDCLKYVTIILFIVVLLKILRYLLNYQIRFSKLMISILLRRFRFLHWCLSAPVISKELTESPLHPFPKKIIRSEGLYNIYLYSITFSIYHSIEESNILSY